MAKSKSHRGYEPEPSGTSWKFLALFFGGIVLLAGGIVAGIALTAERTEPNPTAPDGGAAVAVPPQFPGRLSLDCEVGDIPTLCGDTSGWVIRPSPGKPKVGVHWEDLCRLGDGSIHRTLEVNGNIGWITGCSPAGDLLVNHHSGGRDGIAIRTLHPETGRTTKFLPYPVKPKKNQLGSAEALDFCRVLDGNRILTAHNSGAFDIWTADGTRLSGVPADPKAKVRTNSHFPSGRATSLTPDSKLFVQPNADGFTVFDTTTSTAVVTTDPITAVETKAPFRGIVGAAIRLPSARGAGRLHRREDEPGHTVAGGVRR